MSGRARGRGLSFLVYSKGKLSGENLIPHLSSSIRKIVPDTRAQSALVSGIAILLILKLRGEQIIPRNGYLCFWPFGVASKSLEVLK